MKKKLKIKNAQKSTMKLKLLQIKKTAVIKTLNYNKKINNKLKCEKIQLKNFNIKN